MSEDTTKNTGNEQGAMPPEEAKGLLKTMQSRVNTSTDKWTEQFKELRRLRKFIAGKTKRDPLGDFYDDGSGTEGKKNFHQANIVYATLQGLLPHLYARDPEVAVRPAKHVDPSTDSYKVAGQFSDTLELVINKVFQEARLKVVAKQSIRETLISSLALTKVSYQADYYRDPIIIRRQEDLQAKLARVRATAQKAESEDLDDQERESEMELLENEIEALQSQVEVLRAEGLVIDPLPIEDFRMDPQVDTLQRYTEARWMAQCTWMTPEDAQSTFGLTDEEMKEFNRFKRTDAGIPQRMGEELAAENQGDKDLEHDACVIPFWELWDRDSNSVYTWGEGAKQWARDPFQPERMGKRWYPFFLLAFNWLDNSNEWPISDVAILENLGREYDTIRKQSKEHRKLSKPHYVTDSTAVQDRADIEAFTVAGLGDVTAISAAGRPVNEVFKAAEPPAYNPAIYDTTQIRTDVEWLSGLGDAQRGGVLRAKTATEAQIQQGGLGARMDEKRDQLEDWLSEMAIFASEMLIQEMSITAVQRIAGPNAFWPQMDRETLYTMVEVEIRAGSTGKPDKAQDMETWIQLLPMIEANIQRVMQMRAQGVPDKENVWIQLLQETLKRTDESIDLEKFLPGEPVEEEAPNPMAGQVGPEGATPEEMAQQERQGGQGQGGQGGADPEMEMAAQEQQMVAQEQQMQMQQQQQQMQMQQQQAKMQADQQAAQLRMMQMQQKMQQDQELHQAKMMKIMQDLGLSAETAEVNMDSVETKTDLAVDQAEHAMKMKEKTAKAQAKATSKPAK